MKRYITILLTFSFFIAVQQAKAQSEVATKTKTNTSNIEVTKIERLPIKSNQQKRDEKITVEKKRKSNSPITKAKATEPKKELTAKKKEN